MSNLFSISLSGALFISVIVVLRLLLKNRLPRTAFVVLWLAAVFRLLCPVKLPFAASVWNVWRENAPSRGEGAGTVKAPVSEIPLQATAGMAEEGWSFSETIWLATAALLLAGIAGLYLYSLYSSRKASRIQKGVYLCKGIVSPRVCGILCPRILLPDGISQELLPYILLHERIHILRLDNLWKLLALAAAAVHWFNPAAWLMIILLGRDLEVSCDEWVLNRLPEEEKSSYALSLIAVAEHCERRSPLTCGFSRNPLEERIRCIMKKKKSIIAVCAAAIMIMGTTAVFATDAAADKKAEQAKDKAAAEKQIDLEEAKVYKDLKQYTAAEYEEHMKAELKSLKKQLAKGELSQETYDKSVKELKDTLEKVKKGTAIAFYPEGDKEDGGEFVLSGKGIGKDDVKYYEVKEDGAEGIVEEGVIVTIDDDAVNKLKAGKNSKTEK